MPGVSPAGAAAEAASRVGLAGEAAQFAASVAEIVRRHPTPDPWEPGAAVSDGVDELDAALLEAGFGELATDPELLPLVAPAALELGRGLAALRPIDLLLGGALADPRGALARYPSRGRPLVIADEGRLELRDFRELRPVAYADSLGVAEVLDAAPAGTVGGGEAEVRMNAWMAASAGYLAGVGAAALDLALEHTRSRVAFGRPLAALAPVQQTLADAATNVEGLRLLSGDEPGADALAYAGDAAVRALGGCQQVTGALGFTLEFPMQRAYRRVRSCRVWNEAVLSAWGGP